MKSPFLNKDKYDLDLELGFLGGSVVKNLHAKVPDAVDTCAIHGLERSLGEGNSNPLHYSCLGNPIAEGPGEL